MRCRLTLDSSEIKNLGGMVRGIWTERRRYENEKIILAFRLVRLSGGLTNAVTHLFADGTK